MQFASDLLQCGYLNWRSKSIIAAVIISFPTLFLSAVLLQPWVEPKWMFLDTLTAAELSGDCCHVYYGFVSNLGILLWCGTAAVCFTAAAVFFAAGSSFKMARFAISASFLTGWLALDDMFLLHELVLPSLGVPQTVVIAIYGVLTLAYLSANWRFLIKQEWWILALGGIALAVSVFVDTAFHSLVPALVYLEDSAKFFGIVCWASFHLVTIHLHFVGQIVTTQTKCREEI